MITLLLYLVLFTTILVLAVKISTSTDMIFEAFGKYGESRVKEGNIIFQALVLCVYCMPSIYTFLSIGIAFLLDMFHHVSFIQIGVLYILCVGASSVIAGTIWSLIGMINSKTEYLDAAKGYYDKAKENQHYDLCDRRDAYNSKRERINGQGNSQKVYNH